MRTAKRRAEQRVQKFLDAAQAIITEKGTTDFTVQEVVDRSRQSLRSFYLQFDGKHELLLALFEDALNRTAEQLRAAADGKKKPIDKLQVTVELLFELCRPDPAAQRPLFTDFAPQLLVSHPAQVKVAHAPLLALFSELMEQAAQAGQVRADVDPHRTAAMVMQTVMFTAQSSGSTNELTQNPLTATEVWNFCARGFAGK
nr:TetR/AcrR family transcriptional regulator [Nocardia transvalensis]